jgi:hypothetical protein
MDRTKDGIERLVAVSWGVHGGYGHETLGVEGVPTLDPPP